MDAGTDALAETVRAKRVAVDNDLELLRVRLQSADPRRVDLSALTSRVLPAAAATASLWLLTRRRRPVGSLQQLMMHCLADLYQVEHDSLGFLERMRARASSGELKRAFAQHHFESRGHIERLERVFRSIGAKPPKRRSSRIIQALIADGDRVFARKLAPRVRDASLIAAVQRLEHLEIAAYGTARAYAETLGYTVAAQLLEHTLEEERSADRRLSRLAEYSINPSLIRV